MGQAEKQLCDECRGKGPTISGTWYLGALSGGNVDVATDVIRELVSEVHERDRMIQGSAAPVTKRFYESFVPEASGGPARYPRYDAPYAKLVGLVCSSRGGREHTDDRQIPTFPFCRSRIREYTSISLDLVQLVRQVMELDEDALGEPSFASRIQECVKRTLAKIRHTYEQRPVEHAEALR